MTLYRHELAERALSALPADAADAAVTAAIVDYTMTRGPAPYKLQLDHDPNVAPCPVYTDWRRGKVCGAKFEREHQSAIARNWIARALSHGYTVTRLRGSEELSIESIAGTRSRIEKRDAYAAKRALAQSNGLPDPDDEIPF